MVQTRSSKREEESAPSASEATPGSKHKTEPASAPKTKRGKTAGSNKQKTAAAKSEADHLDDAPTSGDSAVEPGGRDEAMPSNMLEKGIIYFFFRGRVNVDSPHGTDDIQRSYIILRPIGRDAKLGDGPIGDAGNSRLCALPKKVLPTSGRDRFVCFVEKSSASFADLKRDFLPATDYETKTAGTRHRPAATPAGEGIYAITTTGRESHLAYMLTVPASGLGEVQRELGLREKGSFIVSTKNPKYPSAPNAPSKTPDFSKEVLDSFRSLRWMPTRPEHLDFADTQFLLIGESAGLDKATRPDEKDAEEQKRGEMEEPLEELEKLEAEDTHRMQDLAKDDSAAIFADLEANAKDYPKLQTTF